MSTAHAPIFRQALIVERKAAPPADGADAAASEPDPFTFDVVASDESIDAFGTILRGWRLERFAQNPIILYAHDHAEPVGLASNVQVDPLRMTVTLAEAGTSPVVDKVRSLRRQGILRGVSVGCLPGGFAIEQIDGREVMVLSDNELLELSVCAVPANPNALAEMRALALQTTRRPGATTPPRPPMSTAKKPVTRTPTEGDPKPAEGDPKPAEKDAAGDAEHQVYVDEVSLALDAVEGLDDAQRASVKEAVMAALESARAKVDAMETEEDPEPAMAEAAARSTIAELSTELGQARAALKAAELRADKVERDAILDRAKTDRQWSPALAPFLAALPLAQLRAWKASAPAVVPGGEIAPPSDASTNDRQLPTALADAVARATKDGWLSLSPADRAAIVRHDPALSKRLKTARQG